MSEIDPVRPPPPPMNDPHGLSRGGSSSEFQEVLRRQSVEKSTAEESKKRKRHLESKEEQKAEKKSESSEKTEKDTTQKQIEKKKGSLNLALPVKTSTEKALPSPAAAPLATEKLSPGKKETPSPLIPEAPIEIGKVFQTSEEPQLSPDEHIGEVLHHPNPPAAPHIGEKKEITSSEEIAVSPTEAKKAPPTPVTGTITRVIGQLPPQIADMFERMAGVMTIMNNTGMRQTTIELNSPQFANSPYFGSKIVIQEFNAAPKVFNITLVGSPQAVNSFQKQIGSLQAAFQAGDYAFRVHRLETSLIQEEAPVLERKEAASHDEEKQGKQGK